MSDYLPIKYHKEDPYYVRSMGFEDNALLAHWGPGYRDYCILHFVISGCGYFNGNKVTANQGFFIGANELHEYHSDCENPWTYCWIIFSEELAASYVWPLLKEKDNHIFAFPNIGKLNRLFRNTFAEYHELTHMQALGLFFQITAMCEETGKTSSKITERYVQRAKLYIDQNFNKNISVGEVAREVFVNERYLYNLFMKYEKISIKEYINRQRFDLACELLANTGLTVGEIGQSVGYGDVLGFSKFFSARAGVSPLKYREINTI